MAHRLFPYERALGLREVERLGCEAVDTGGELQLVSGDPERLVARATYLAEVTRSDGSRAETRQAAVERMHLESRKGSVRRQATRYGLHGVHEYKGKFNPQIVRALCNVVDPDAEVLIDPFCGSGTSLIEGLRLGLDVVGVDGSPMAALLASTKVTGTLDRSAPAGGADLAELVSGPMDAPERGQNAARSAPLDGVLSPAAVEYLGKWFTEPAFAAMTHGLSLLLPRRDELNARLCLLALSSIVRSVSLQAPEDLRIRRRASPYVAPSLAEAFGAAASRVEQGLREVRRWPEATGSWSVVRGFAERSDAYRAVPASGRRLIVTSPPYATALPYIDTDRISMVALGLVEPHAIGARERELTGSREWSRAEQRDWDARRAQNEAGLPRPVADLLDRIDRLNASGGAGFRRRAVPSLLYRYFVRMQGAMRAWADVLRDGECAALVVGHNRTRAGDEAIDVPTPELLGEIARSAGFEVLERTALETWPRYGLHSGNAVTGEDLLVLRRR